ncbi:hypothetical protein HY78_14605 [Rhizorhabdus wittichii DC-6]|nr:hypothetical protein HY78_14605 [Rhizorhabdus wittichii DC-6]
MAENRTAQLDPRSLSLKRAFRALVGAAGGQEEAAKLCRRIRRHQTHSDYGAPNVDQFAPVDVIAELEEVTMSAPGWPHVTRELCARAGGLFVPAPPGELGAADWLQRCAQLLKEHADLSGGLARALADGTLCARDIHEQNLVAEAEHLFALSGEVYFTLRRMVGEV